MRESNENNKHLFNSETCYDLRSPEYDTKLTFDLGNNTHYRIPLLNQSLHSYVAQCNSKFYMNCKGCMIHELYHSDTNS